MALGPKTWKPQPFIFGDQVLDQLANLAGYKPKPDRLTLDQRAALGVVNLKDHLEETAARLLETLGGYPSKADWRDHRGHNYVTPVKNQGFCSACAAFGSVAAVEALVRIQGQTDQSPPLSEGQLYFQTPGGQTCQSGWDIDDALAALKCIQEQAELERVFGEMMGREPARRR